MKMRKQCVVAIVLCILVLVSQSMICFAQDENKAGNYTRTVEFKGLARTYNLHVPTINTNTARALVIVCHGGGMTGQEMEETTQFDALSDEKGFIVVYPDAVEKGWNDDRVTTMERRALRENIDDVGYISFLIDGISHEWNINPNQVFITGMSNGGMFTQRVARELTSKIAGFASAVAPTPETRNPLPNPSKPIPAMFILGAEDPVIPWDGGDLVWGKSVIGRGKAISGMIDYWVKQNRADLSISITYEQPDKTDGGFRHEIYKSQMAPQLRFISSIITGINGRGEESLFQKPLLGIPIMRLMLPERYGSFSNLYQ